MSSRKTSPQFKALIENEIPMSNFFKGLTIILFQKPNPI